MVADRNAAAAAAVGVAGVVKIQAVEDFHAAVVKILPEYGGSMHEEPGIGGWG